MENNTEKRGRGRPPKTTIDVRSDIVKRWRAGDSVLNIAKANGVGLNLVYEVIRAAKHADQMQGPPTGDGGEPSVVVQRTNDESIPKRRKAAKK